MDALEGDFLIGLIKVGRLALNINAPFMGGTFGPNEKAGVPGSGGARL